MGMNGMSAGQVLRRLSRGKHVFSADGAVVLVLILEALVGIKDTDGDAHATLVAMTEGFDTAHAAEPTAVAMERFLAQGHPQVTHDAMALSKLSLAVDALVSVSYKGEQQAKARYKVKKQA